MNLRVLGVVCVWLSSTPAVAQALPPLHAEPDRQRGGRIVDSSGRDVLLRGVNVNALAEYWKGSRFRTVFPLARRDPARMRAIGWNAVRLLLSWSRVEPRPGHYDERYLDRVSATARRLERHGIYTILDLHQDAWGPSLAARPGESCTAPSRPAIGWDGAPAWATVAGDAPRCTTGTRETVPAVRAAWGAFFANLPGPGGVGLQTRYVRMLRQVSSRFASAGHIAGIDLMNEPNAFGAAENAALSRFYARALRAVRAGERSRGGRRHLVLFEPSALWSLTGAGAPPDFARDRDVVYAPHVYSGSIPVQGPIRRSAYEVAVEEARGFGGAPVLVGEWGGDPDRAADPDDSFFSDHLRFQSELRVSSTLWTWRESCGDPHKIEELRNAEADVPGATLPEVWGEFEVDCATNRIAGPRRALIADLTAAYVQAAPGRLRTADYDPANGRFRAQGVAGGSADGRVVVFYPSRRGVRLRVTGLRDVRASRPGPRAWRIGARPAGGRWTLQAAGSGARRIRAAKSGYPWLTRESTIPEHRNPWP